MISFPSNLLTPDFLMILILIGTLTCASSAGWGLVKKQMFLSKALAGVGGAIVGAVGFSFISAIFPLLSASLPIQPILVGATWFSLLLLVSMAVNPSMPIFFRILFAVIFVSSLLCAISQVIAFPWMINSLPIPLSPQMIRIMISLLWAVTVGLSFQAIQPEMNRFLRFTFSSLLSLSLMVPLYSALIQLSQLPTQ